MPQYHFDIGCTSLGYVAVVMANDNLLAVMLADDADSLEQLVMSDYPTALYGELEPMQKQRFHAVLNLIESPDEEYELPYCLEGTDFQQQVWTALTQIPAGTTVSYSELAHKIGRPNAVRAVASACASNKLAVLIPCHRVVAKQGGMAGYRWGVDRKIALLQRELSYSQHQMSLIA